MPKFSISTVAAGSTVLIIPVSKENRSTALAAAATGFGIEAERLTADFTADKGENFLFYPTVSNFKKVVLLGLGEKPHLKSVGETVTAFTAGNRTKLEGPIAFDLAHFPELHGEHLLTKLVCAIEAGLFALGLYKKEAPKESTWKEVIFLTNAEGVSIAKKQLKRAEAIATGQQVTRSLVYEPANYLTPDLFQQRVEKLGKKFGFTVTCFDKKALEKKGMNGILAVGSGSAVPPRLLILSYEGAPKTKNLAAAFVGKGVTFDTGGISIKDANNMHFMKSDMAGAAAVVGLFCTLAGTKTKLNIAGVLPVVENMPDGAAFRPSDVIKSYAGLSIEVLDTDAEGRIILADALAYAAKDLAPAHIIDLATLTGSVVTALGYQAAGLYTQNSDLASKLEIASAQTGERVWRMPMWDEYNAQIASDIADVKNLGGPPAGSITAAKFLEKFTLAHPSWAHIDIAGVALATVGWAKDRVATGYGVELLSAFVQSLQQD